MRDGDDRVAPLDLAEEEPLTPDELRHFQARLQALRREVAARMEQHLDVLQVDVDEPRREEGDLAALAVDQVLDLRLSDKEQKLLVEIDRALEKFLLGEYGICEGTGEQIRRKRLEMRPWTRYSVAHKEQLERQARDRRR